MHPDVAQISEEIVARPFQDETAVLRAGVHLHWALPDALTRGRHGEDGTAFPVVPNRWLVRRRAFGAKSLPERVWMVESDYVHPDGTGATMGVAVPFPAAPQAGKYAPFRFLGRVLPLELWQPADPAAEYPARLTAVGFELAGGAGYSDPAFAALYPNCHSVFGFHDSEVTGAAPAGLRYDLIGWYGNLDQDFLRATGTASVQTLERYAGWTFAAGTDPAFPERTLCYASLGFLAETPSEPGEPTVVTIGNTGTEALSVALGARLDRDRRFGLEDQLEAIQLAARIEHRTVDADARFRAMRHEKGFTPHRGDRMWTIRPATSAATAQPADAELAQARTEVSLSPELADLLDALNEAQRIRDRAATELESARRQLFADWYKYLICAYPPEDTGDGYPDIDEARAFLETRILPRLHEREGALEPAPDTPESRLRAAYDAVARALDTLNAQQQLRDATMRYELAAMVAPRFWQPTDPVVLLTGDDARATERHGQDGRLRADALLTCHAVPAAAVAGILAGKPSGLGPLLDDLRAREAGRPDSVAFRDSDGSPWNPFQLEWEVELLPLRDKGNIHPEADSYEPGFVTGNYTLTGLDPDLVRTGPPAVAGAATVYSGASFLTPNAGQRLGRSLTEYLRKEILPKFNAASGKPPVTDPEPVIADIRSWYERTQALDTADKRAADQAYTAIRACQELLGLDFLAQALGGFNDALLMHRQVKQLPIGDPLGFAEDQAFAEAVGKAVGTSNRSAPEPLNDFNPIRSGALRLLRLRLVDTFGQTREVPVDTVLPAETLTTPGNPDLITLPPRLSQPARVVFRWLDADADRETNVHPRTNPICGWFLPNHVDTSLMVYDAEGQALGSLDRLARWQPAPGESGVASVPDIGNTHLRDTVAAFVTLGRDFLAQFLSALDGALENVEPAAADAHVDLAVLIGRPVALVRAALDLELLGLPAVHQGWNQFRQDMARSTRDTDGFTRVAFPVQLGAYQQLDDGLIGYWIGGGTTFHSPQTDGFAHTEIRTYADGPLHIPHSVDDPTLVLRMLVDPRGMVHVTTGVQPVKAIGIPPAHYVPALSRIEVTFPTGPLLTDLGAVNLPMPVEPGYRWAWVCQRSGVWAEVTEAPTIERDTFTAALAARIWDQLIDPHIGWLQPVPGATGRIRAVGTDERVAALDPPFRALAGLIEPILAPLGETMLERAATITRLAEAVALPAWNTLLSKEIGWLEAAGTRALIVAKDGRQPKLTGVLAGAEPLVDSILALGQERIGPPTTLATFAPQELLGGWLDLRPTGQAG